MNIMARLFSRSLLPPLAGLIAAVSAPVALHAEEMITRTFAIKNMSSKPLFGMVLPANRDDGITFKIISTRGIAGTKGVRVTFPKPTARIGFDDPKKPDATPEDKGAKPKPANAIPEGKDLKPKETDATTKGRTPNQKEIEESVKKNETKPAKATGNEDVDETPAKPIEGKVNFTLEPITLGAGDPDKLPGSGPVQKTPDAVQVTVQIPAGKVRTVGTASFEVHLGTGRLLTIGKDHARILCEALPAKGRMSFTVVVPTAKDAKLNPESRSQVNPLSIIAIDLSGTSDDFPVIVLKDK